LAKSKTPSFILTLYLKTELYQENLIDKEFEKYRRIYNACISELYKRYNHMKESKIYQENCKYRGKDRNKKFNNINKQYGLTEYSFHDYVKLMNKHFKTNSFITQKIATRAFNAFQKLMLHKADKIKFKSYGTLDSIESKNNTTGIIYKNGYIKFLDFQIPIIIKPNDKYAQMAIQSRVKFCRLLIKEIKGKKRYYIQLILEGIPPKKINKDGEIIGDIGQGNVGIDIGTRTIAYSSQYEVGLNELSPETNGVDKQLKILQRKMDRSKRATNPNKYNENGIINIKNKDKWIYSNHYIKVRNIRKELYRKQREIRKQSHYKSINHLLSLGDKFYVETMNYKGLQKKSKKTIKNKNGRYNKKKRFGKSLGNKAPAMFLSMLDQKLKYNNEQLYKIDTYNVKASQYNHIEDKFIKKELGERWNDFYYNDEQVKIQRDLYSAFLIMNVNNNLKSIDRDKCIKTFNNFKEFHDKEIERIKLDKNNKRIIKSMGI